jgi:hypothetical protein
LKKKTFLQKLFMQWTFFLFKTHCLENYDGTDRRTVGAYTGCAKTVTIFRSLFD